MTLIQCLLNNIIIMITALVYYKSIVQYIYKRQGEGQINDIARCMENPNWEEWKLFPMPEVYSTSSQQHLKEQTVHLQLWWSGSVYDIVYTTLDVRCTILVYTKIS